MQMFVLFTRSLPLCMAHDEYILDSFPEWRTDKLNIRLVFRWSRICLHKLILSIVDSHSDHHHHPTRICTSAAASASQMKSRTATPHKGTTSYGCSVPVPCTKLLQIPERLGYLERDTHTQHIYIHFHPKLPTITGKQIQSKRYRMRIQTLANLVVEAQLGRQAARGGRAPNRAGINRNFALRTRNSIIVFPWAPCALECHAHTHTHTND